MLQKSLYKTWSFFKYFLFFCVFIFYILNLLIKLFEGNADNTDVLYKLIYNYGWHKLISPDKTFLIRSKINSRLIANQNFTTLKMKDAIVDRINKEVGSRPSIDKKHPDYYITIYIIFL